MDIPYTILSAWRPNKEIEQFFQKVKQRQVTIVPGEQYITFTASPPESDGRSQNLVTQYKGTANLPKPFASQSEQLKTIAESEAAFEKPPKRKYKKKLRLTAMSGG